MKLATRISLLIFTATVASTAFGVVDATEAFSCDTLTSIQVVQPTRLEELVVKKSINSVSKSNSTPDQNAAEDEQIESQSTSNPAKSAGYRVQVFSDNNQRTAKGEARSKEAKMREAFPAFNTYIVYNSPFWRLKVGDFRTRDEAEAAADAIKLHFPSFAREIRVVRDRINKY